MTLRFLVTDRRFLWTLSAFFSEIVRLAKYQCRKSFSNSNKTWPSNVVVVKYSRPRATLMMTVFLATRSIVQMDLRAPTRRKEKEYVSVTPCIKINMLTGQQRAAPPGRCHSCNRAETPEWRRGPDGARTLCNACGLRM